MPTFSNPSSNNVVTSSSSAAAAAAAAMDAPKKKSRNTKKTVKGESQTEKPTVVHSDSVCIIDNPNDEPTVVEHNEEEVRHEPTFPDIVILKQTDKNYIVKHNHYPVSSTDKKTNEDTANVVACSNHDESETVIQPSDLVSPNQIYKGQINKKRGRKPKAGFILNSNSGIYDASQVPNIILHLKCHLSDLKTNESISNYDYTPSISEVESYNMSSNILQSSDLCQTYNEEYDDEIHDTDTIEHNMYPSTPLSSSSAVASASVSAITLATAASASTSAPVLTAAVTANAAISVTANSTAPSVKKAPTDSAVHVLNERHQKEIMKKINRLKYSFHNGETIQMKLNHKCACFWDTCEFDGPIYYLPIMIVNGVFHVSGCFCSPECALAALLKEQLDTSTKFERIHLLHLLYGSSSNKGFKPAPNPNYLLDKYYGNLTIDEYRSLLKGPQMIHIVNKPLTHILPELYEDNNDFLVNSKVIPTNNLKLKKRYKTMVVQGGAD